MTAPARPTHPKNRHYDYSPWHRTLEIVAIAICLSLMGRLGWRVADAAWAEDEPTRAVWVLGAGAIGYLAADLVSGVVHWLADRFGTPQTPVLGEAFVRPFREHHDFPKALLDHDFIEVNGNNSVVMLLFLVPVFWALPAELEAGWLGAASFALSFAVAIFMTNQFHKWAHADQPPAPVRWLQRRGWILSPEAHDRHHTAPYETDYCITSGWMNPLLAKLGVFARIERMVGRQETAERPMGQPAGE